MNTKQPNAALNITPATHPLDAAIVAALREDLPGLQSVYRYGSAGGPYERPDSDIDIAFLTDQPLALKKGLELAGQLMQVTRHDVDLNDLRTLPLGLRVQIALTGIRLYAANPAAAEEYDSRTLSDYVRLNEERGAILTDIAQRGSIYG